MIPCSRLTGTVFIELTMEEFIEMGHNNKVNMVLFADDQVIIDDVETSLIIE